MTQENGYHQIPMWRDLSESDWNDWHWQLRNRITSVEQLRGWFPLTPSEEEAARRTEGRLVMAIPPYWASLMDPQDPNCPIRRQCIPTMEEFNLREHDLLDPCGEDGDMPVPGLVHRYPDRVLFLVTEQCAMYCRHCTRRRLVGTTSRGLMSSANYEATFAYLRAHPEVRDVLISGGDPLMLTESRLEKILAGLRAIPSIEFIRIGSRTPVTMPQRVTPEFCELLKRYKPIWMSLHFCHPKEVTPRLKQAMDLLADSGVPLGSQTVLLRGINDDPAVMKRLMHELLKVRVRPYYIYQCDPAQGISHFRTSVERGVGIIESLRGHTTGYAVPTYVIDGPGGGGKIPINPNYVVGYEKGVMTLRNYAGEQYAYYEPEEVQKPAATPTANGNGHGCPIVPIRTLDDLLKKAPASKR